MMRQDVLYLIEETPEAHGIFEQHKETERMVYCTVRSVGMNEYYRALENSLRPTFVFTLTDYADYGGEKICVFDGTRYRIVRTYVNGQQIELTVEETTVDAETPEPEEVPADG